MSLLERLKAEIAATGPMGVDAYMARCLHDPEYGYYATRPALGEDGDFITAPMVSQMFGELIGLWAVETWRRMDAPERLLLVELGPGDGSLMRDALRAARLAPEFLAAAELWLVETSKPLIERQQAALAAGPLEPHWAEGLEALPEGATIAIANEVFDCLPAAQYLRSASRTAERVVGLDAGGELTFGLRPAVIALSAQTPCEAIVEISPAQQALAAQLAVRVASAGGAALVIDYGDKGGGDTLQALKRHQKVDPLACPGEADLTVHADFRAICEAARAAGAETSLLTQAEFLRRLGIEQRAAALTAARPDRAERIGGQLERLVGENEMGRLFKAACIHDRTFTPPGFEAAAWPS